MIEKAVQMNNIIQNNSITAYILLNDKNLSGFSYQLKQYWNIDVNILSYKNKNKFDAHGIYFEYEFAPFNVPYNEAEILINYNDIDNETKEKILNHKSFLSIKA